MEIPEGIDWKEVYDDVHRDILQNLSGKIRGGIHAERTYSNTREIISNIGCDTFGIGIELGMKVGIDRYALETIKDPGSHSLTSNSGHDAVENSIVYKRRA